MAISEEPTTQDSNEESSEEEIKFHFFTYLVIFFTIYSVSLMIPITMFISYMGLFFIPHFLEITDFFSLFTEIESLLGLITFPLCLITWYLVRLFFIALLTRLFWRFTEKKSPSKSGIIPRNIPSKTLTYYHLRGFLMKYPKNFVMKGIFPWVANWFFNFVGSNIIGKGSTIEESGGSDKFVKVGKNCYIGVDSVLSSHLVEGIFGNVSYFQIKVGDNVTGAGKNLVGPGTEIHDNSCLLPLASSPKHNILKGNNYYFGIPIKKIFRKSISEYLQIDPRSIANDQEIRTYLEKINKELLEKKDFTNLVPKIENNEESIGADEPDFSIDFTTSSAISRVNLKFLIIYLPIFWLSGLLIGIFFYTYTSLVTNIFVFIFFLPIILLLMFFMFIIGCLIFSKLFLILINLIHKPKEGIFIAKIGDQDFEFWMLRKEVMKIVLWLVRNWPLPWVDVLVFKWFGIKMDFSSNLYDSWCDSEFVKIGRKVLVGQQSVVMSSMVVGKYLIIKRIIFDNYSVIGGHACIAPGTIVGQDSVVGALTTTTFNQFLEPGWVYLGTPSRKLKPNKYAEERKKKLVKKDVDEERKYEVEHDVNIDEDKKDLI